MAKRDLEVFEVKIRHNLKRLAEVEERMRRDDVRLEFMLRALREELGSDEAFIAYAKEQFGDRVDVSRYTGASFRRMKEWRS